MAAAEPPVSQATPPPTADEVANPGAAATPTTPAPTAVAEPANVPATKADDQTPSIAATKQPPLPEMQGATLPQPAADDEAANSGAAAAPTPPAPTAGTAPPVAEPANAPATKADDQTPSVPAVEQPPQAKAQSATPTQPTPAEPANAGTATPKAQLKPVAIEQPHQPDAQAAATAAPVAEPVDSGTPAGAGQAPAPLVKQPKQAATATEPVARAGRRRCRRCDERTSCTAGPRTGPGEGASRRGNQTGERNAESRSSSGGCAGHGAGAARNRQGEAAAPQAEPQAETVVAMNVPTPPATASDSIDTVADRISWLRDYRGGDCFYATVTSATDKAIEIEGFGTDSQPVRADAGRLSSKVPRRAGGQCPAHRAGAMRDHQLPARPWRHGGQKAEACARPHIRSERFGNQWHAGNGRRPQDQPVADRQQGNGVQPRRARHRARGQSGLQRSDQPWRSRPSCRERRCLRSSSPSQATSTSRQPSSQSRRRPASCCSRSSRKSGRTDRNSQRRRNISGLADSIAI